MRKRILSIITVLALCIGLLPPAALAAGEHDSHSNNWTEFTAGTTTLSGGSYYLSGDVEYSGTESITVSVEVILCLNGKKLDLNKQHISVGSGASLTLCDCSTGGVLTGGSGGKGGGVYVDGGGTFTMTGGSIAGNTAESGGGVYVDEGGTFTMEDGSISNNQVTSGGGGGVMVNKGSFTLSGGSITGNATSDATYGYGGGVCLYGTFNLSGDAIIQNNTKAGATDNLYLGWNTINITGPLGENARIGVTAEGVPRSFISGWSDNMAGEDPADYFSSDGDALGIGLNADGNVVLGSLCTTITLNPNGGTLPEYSLVEGAALPIPTKTGYTFAGWYENPKFSGDPVKDVPTDSTENLNFYAKWTANTYTVTFDANGGSVSQTSAVTVAGKLTSLPTPTYDGYDFLGWYTQKDGGDKVTTDTVFTVDSTIYAHWQNIPVIGVKLDKTSLTMQETGSDTLTATVEPDNATNKNVNWESSDTSIATVDASGKVTAISAGNATITATAADGSGKSATCTVTVTAKPSPDRPVITKPSSSRISGADRFETAMETADQLKKELGVTEFSAIVVACSDDFADALSASAFAHENEAPVLIVNENNEERVKTYIEQNLTKDGTVYIMGGSAAVTGGFEDSLSDFDTVRFAGDDRYETNLNTLKELDLTGKQDIIIASGMDFADALSASSTGCPIMIVGERLTEPQIAFLKTLGGDDTYYIAGGTAAVSVEVEEQLRALNAGSVKRLAGEDRYETGVLIAETFYGRTGSVYIASGEDFPDGLTGGVLAGLTGDGKGAPLILVNRNNTERAAEYIDDVNPRSVKAIGGKAAVPDDVLKAVI